MKKPSKKIIEEAIKSELLGEVIIEGPLGKAFDAPARAIGAVGNMFSGIGGQMKLGSINKQLDRVASRVDKDWDEAEQVVTKLATKMSQSKNPQVRQKAQAVAQNVNSASTDIKNATNKLKQISQAGADVDQSSGSSIDSKLGVRKIKDKYGFTTSENAVDRWISSFGGDLRKMSKPEQGKMQKMFMDLVSAGIDPFEVPKEKQEMLRQYHNYRMAEIADTGTDPFPDYEHFEKVLGPDVANKIRKNDSGLQKNKKKQEMDSLASKIGPGPADQTRMAPPQPQSNNQLQKNVAAAPAKEPVKQKSFEEMIDGAQISDQLKDHVKTIFQKAQKAGVAKNMIGKYLVNMLPSSEDTAYTEPNDVQFLRKLEDKYTPTPVVNSFGGGDFNEQPAPVGPNWQTVAKMNQQKVQLPPEANKPVQPVLPQNQKLEDFLSFDENPKFANPAVPSLVQNPPVQDLGNEIQYGSEKKPAMLPKSMMLPKIAQKKLPKNKTKK